jgi:transketolase
MTDTTGLDKLAINTIRTLSVDTVQAAKSGADHFSLGAVAARTRPHRGL